MATHSSILAWRIPQTEEPGRLQAMGSRRVRHDWETKQECKHLITFAMFYWWEVTHRSSFHSEERLIQGCESQKVVTSGEWKLLSQVWLFATLWTLHGILQAGILEWVAFPFSRGSSQPRDRTQVSHIAGRLFTSWATREAQEHWSGQPIPSPGDLPNPGIKLGSPALQADSGEGRVQSGVRLPL